MDTATQWLGYHYTATCHSFIAESKPTPPNWKSRLQGLATSQGMRNMIQYSMKMRIARKIFKHVTNYNWKLEPKDDGLLLEVIEKCCLEVLELLLASGANPNAKNREGKTALMLAGSKENIRMMRALIKVRANVEICDSDGERVLMHIAKRGQIQAAKLLIRSRARKEARDKEGRTALMIAASNGQEKMVEFLISLGSKIDSQDRWGFTPLAVQIEAGDKPKMISLLKSLGADARIATCMVENVFFAHAWGLEGKSSIIDKTGVKLTYELEGLRPSFALRKLLENVQHFFAFNPAAGLVSQEHQREIKKAIKNAKTVSKVLSRMQAQRPILILGGTENHAISIVACKDYTKSGHYKLGICNRGEGAQTLPTQEYTTQFYLLPPSAINQTVVDQLAKDHESMAAFYKMIEDLKLIRVGGYNQKLQKAEICAWASSKGGLGMLYVLCTGQSMGLKTYKAFTSESREKSLGEYLYLEKPNQDINILRQVKEKYYKKAGLVFYKKIVDSLLEACKIES